MDLTKNENETFNKKRHKVLTKQRYVKSNLIYNYKHSFYKYSNIKIYDNLSFDSKHKYLLVFKLDWENFNQAKTTKKAQKKKSKSVWYSFWYLQRAAIKILWWIQRVSKW